jgi:hypothetical protein
MRRIRLAAAGVLAGAVIVSGAGAVLADTTAGTATTTSGTATSTFTNPASDGSTISAGPVVLSGVINRPGGNIDQIKLIVRWTDTATGRPKIDHPDQVTTITPPTTSSYSWSDPVTASANGGYRIFVTATTDDGSGPNAAKETTISSQGFVLDIPPVAPANLADTVQASARTVSLTWNANPEQDLLGYDVFRGGPTSKDQYKFLNGVLAPGTGYVDKDVSTQPAGTYRYVIVAVRPSGAGGSHLDYSPLSTESDAAFTTPPVTTPPPSSTSGQTGGGTAGTGTGTAAHGGTGAGRGTAPVVILPPGNGLSNYNSVVGQALATTATTQPPDPGFQNHLPYQPSTSHQVVTLPDDGSVTTPSGGGGSNSHRTMEYIAGALLLAVLAMFALLLKRVADQDPALEAVDHEAPDQAQSVGRVVVTPVAPSVFDTVLRPVTQPVDAGLTSRPVTQPVDAGLTSRPVAKPIDAGVTSRPVAKPIDAGLNSRPDDDIDPRLDELLDQRVETGLGGAAVEWVDAGLDDPANGTATDDDLVAAGASARPLRSVWRD